MYKMFVQCVLFLNIDSRVGMRVGNSKMLDIVHMYIHPIPVENAHKNQLHIVKLL